MKKILITGAGGFIGSHLVETCVARGMKVRAFVRYNGKNDWGWLETSPVKNKIEVITGDIRDYDSVSAAAAGCDTVFHLAALIGIPYSYVSPLAYVKTNVEGTYNVLEASRKLGVKKLIVTSTSETYGTAQYVPIDEKHPVHAQSPYAASKVGADQLALSYARSFGTPVVVARPFNTYGPRQSARAIIPTVMTQLLSGASTIKLGNTSPTRDLTFVADTCEGFLALANAPKAVGQEVNIGCNQEISVGDLAGLIGTVLKKKVRIIEDKQRMRRSTSEVERLRCDNTKITQLTGWAPRHGLTQGLGKTATWLKANLARYKADIYNV